MITIKSSPLQYSCTHCHKRYVQQQDVQAHIERMHENPCPSSEAELEMEVDEEPSSSSTSSYKCPQCGYTTNRSSMLQRHLRSHTSERSHKCDLCSAAFAQRTDLDIHRCTHTGEKPFKCNVCGKTYTRRSHLTTHLRAHKRSSSKRIKIEQTSPRRRQDAGESDSCAPRSDQQTENASASNACDSAKAPSPQRHFQVMPVMVSRTLYS